MPEPRKRSAEEQQLLEKAEKYLPGGSLGGFRAPKELAFIVHGGKGSKIYDMSGNEYIDYLLGSGPMVLGHAHPAVTGAVRDYLERGTTYFTVNEPVVLLAEEIVQAVPCAEQIRFASTGTEATFFALRAARAFRKRDKVLKFDGAFHGVHDYAIMEGDSAGEFPIAVRKSAGVPKSLEREVLIAPFNDLEMTSEIIQKHQDELGGVIVEPLQRIIPPKKGFLEGLREITRRYEIPLIFDEVVTGFRFAYGGAQEFYGVVPDLAAFGKIIGGGYPLSAVCGKEEIMRHFHPELRESGEAIAQTGTLSGNPIAATAGLATLRELKKPGTYERFF
ncbi:MAG: aminotransferase class III-fold pyridoxal phosphate-dependent enzyme, partial [Candidatus Tectomicrobia bacterium]|nr:aminotransferase class III-fold pyridoxal phosphate-dependent enzyme [Candidatus Tectomicrobia bacterium]